MSEDFRELYDQMIVDHSKRPRNFGTLEGANHHADGHNPLCGDHLMVDVLTEGDCIVDVRFDAPVREDGNSSCAISRASASLMTEFVKGKTIAEAEEIFQRFHELVTGAPDETPDVEELDKLAVFSGVRKFPMRVKCATLAWHTLRAALKDDQQPASTE